MTREEDKHLRAALRRSTTVIGHCYTDAEIEAIKREAEARGMERIFKAAMMAVDNDTLAVRKRLAAAIRAEKEGQG